MRKVTCLRYIKLTHVGFRAHVKIVCRVVSYRNILPRRPRRPRRVSSLQRVEMTSSVCCHLLCLDLVVPRPSSIPHTQFFVVRRTRVECRQLLARCQ